MKLFHYETEHGNFGDDLNLWLWDHVLPGWQDWDDGITLFGVGTVLNRYRLADANRALVMGSGIGYGPPPGPEELAKADIRALRGPRSAAALGLPAETGIVDPAMVIPRLDLPFLKDLRPGSGGTIFVPHHSSLGSFDWETLSRRAGIGFQTPAEEAGRVIRAIAEAERVVAESMHAAILADAFGVPWTAVRFTSGFNDFKWRDWGESLEIDFAIADLLSLPRRAFALLKGRRPAAGGKPSSGAAKPAGGGTGGGGNSGGGGQAAAFEKRLARLKPVLEPYLVLRLRQAARARPTLSPRPVLEARLDRFLETAAAVRRDYG